MGDVLRGSGGCFEREVLRGKFCEGIFVGDILREVLRGKFCEGSFEREVL